MTMTASGVAKLIEECVEKYDAELAAIHDALPDCPTCGGKPFRLRFICCGREDGSQWFATTEDAEAFREPYTSGTAVAEHGYSAGPEEWGHRRAAILDHCPDCVDGKLSLADALAQVKAMHGDEPLTIAPFGWGTADIIETPLRRLRAVRAEQGEQP